MKSLPPLFALGLVLALAHSPLLAQPAAEPEVSAEEIPRVPATEPADALATFEVAPGFDLTLAAHEPEVMDPIAMAFDEKGRAYVLEMRGYSERRDDAICRVRLLEDADHDGAFEKSIIFKDGLKWPTAIVCYKGGVFVGATPDLSYFKDNNGDGVCDEEKTIFTGFGEGVPRLNMQALFNSLRWGPDNRIWGQTAGNGGTVTKPGDPKFEPVVVRGADFSFDPETLDFRQENGTAQYGMSFDSLGRRYVCSNSRHLIWVAYERGQVKENPWFSLPAPLVDIPDDGAAAPVYRISPDEPWRIVRTRWRVAGVVKGTVEGGGRVSGYFTSATGVHLYWGDAFAPEFRDNVFVGDVGSNLVHRKVLKTTPDSVQPVGTRPVAEEKTEFLRSRDNWFRPTNFANGPDGCLYITDMYRETIEHPWSIPEAIKKHVDLNSGNDRGRIYRVAPEGFQNPAISDLGAMSDEELDALTKHPNDWHRTTARRLLFERGKAAPPVPAHEPFPAVLAADQPLLDRLESAAGDRWMEAAVLNSLRTPADLAAAWQASSQLPSGFRGQLAGMIGRANDTALLATVGDSLAHGDPDTDTVALLTSLREGLARGKGDWKTFAADPRWAALTEKATSNLADSAAPAAKRVAAVRLLTLLPAAGVQERFQSALAAGTDDAALAAALVAGINDLDFLVAQFPSLSPGGRNEAGPRLLANAQGSAAFLEAIRGGKIALSDAPASLIENLRRHADPAVAKLASAVLPAIVKRSDVIARYQPALAVKGDPAKGKLAFMKACIACHQSHEGEGIVLGPPIRTFATAGAETILGHILDPNREVAPQYQAYTFQFHDGSSLVGFIASENATETTVRLPGGIDKTFPRSEVASMSGLGQSLMPEGLEATISVEEMGDLLAYLLKTP